MRYIGLAFIALLSGLAINAQEKVYPWGPNFEKEGKLIIKIACDSGETVFKEYAGPTIKEKFAGTEYTRQAYTGITIAVKSGSKYYIFSPNPNSITPITFSYTADKSGNLSEISQTKRDKRLQTEAPNMYARFYDQGDDCKRIEDKK